MNQPVNRPKYSLAEELANSISHGIGTLLSIAGLVILIIMASIYGDSWHMVSFIIYGSSLIILYLASTLYHSFPQERVKHFFNKIDHSAIFLLIAGTYTPFMLINLRGPWGWTIFGTIWGLALIGVILEILFINRFRKIDVAIYILMGWLCVIAFREMMDNVPADSLILLVSGGVVYTVGTIFYGWRSLPFNHAIWHLFVLGGSILHFFAVLNIV